MIDALGKVDVWFLIFLVVFLFVVSSALGGYFLWSVKGILRELKESIAYLRDTISKLYDCRNDHDLRIKVLETRIKICANCNDNHAHAHRRQDDHDDV